MKYFYSRLQSSTQMIAGYKYPQPLSLYLKNYFRSNKKYGSRDRREIQDVIYAYFRCSYLLREHNLNNKIVLSAFLMDLIDWDSAKPAIQKDDKTKATIESLDPRKTLTSQLLMSQAYFDPEFLNKELLVLNGFKNQLRANRIWLRNYNLDQNILASLDQHDKISSAYSTDKWNENEDQRFQIQDLSSQWIVDQYDIKNGDKVWDCCAGAGGKSVAVLHRTNANFYLSDVRQNILTSAQDRLSKHGFKAVELAEIDLFETPENKIWQKEPDIKFDVIIADVPCSGSGTWFRNPEHLDNFDYDMLFSFHESQLKILNKVLPFLKPGGSLYYSTCSIFELENELVIAKRDQAYKLVKESYFVGQDDGADSTFLAHLVKRE